MKQKVIEALNKAREQELHAILQYMLEHYELEDQGFNKLAGIIKAMAIVEMNHAEELAERILFLGGKPIRKPEGDTKEGLSIAEMLKINRDLEVAAVEMYNDFAKLCAEQGDHVSKALFERLTVDEEEHLDEFEKILNHVEKLGSAYIATLTV